MTDASLPRPGALGILVRLALGLAVATIAWDALAHAPSYWDGIADPLGMAPLLAVLVLLSSWVLNELVRRSWGQRPTLVLLAGALGTVAVGAVQGDAFGPAFGAYVWAWALAFSLLLAPAHLLAAVLRTPGCEMRAYMDLWTRLRGGDPRAVACPGWIDRLDSVRMRRRRPANPS